MKMQCSNCQYCRFEPREDNFSVLWCSNSKSKRFRYATPLEQIVYPFDGCNEFTYRGIKAPLWMRTLNKVMKGKKL